ncbi:MAG: hypothetical protein WD512_09070, partial [Candidatus Paceibacterota bacterium]
MTLPVSFNPQSDYQYTLYEPYKYSKATLSKIYQAIKRINQIKSACNLEQGAANYLEAMVLSGLLACPPNSLIVSLIPNLLGETLRLSTEEATTFVQNVINQGLATSEIVSLFQEYQLLHLYGMRAPNLSLLTSLANIDMAIIAEFDFCMTPKLQALTSQFRNSGDKLNLFLIYNDREIVFEELEKLFADLQKTVVVMEPKTFNLLESFEQIQNSTSAINLLFIAKSYAESSYNPLLVYHEALEQRGIKLDQGIVNRPELQLTNQKQVTCPLITIKDPLEI